MARCGRQASARKSQSAAEDCRPGVGTDGWSGRFRKVLLTGTAAWTVAGTMEDTKPVTHQHIAGTGVTHPQTG